MYGFKKILSSYVAVGSVNVDCFTLLYFFGHLLAEQAIFQHMSKANHPVSDISFLSCFGKLPFGKLLRGGVNFGCKISRCFACRREDAVFYAVFFAELDDVFTS